MIFTNEELGLLDGALDQAIASQKRAQNTSKSPMLTPVYAAIERELTALKLKVANINTTYTANTKSNK